MVQIFLVTEPFRSFHIETVPEGGGASIGEAETNLPTTLVSEFIGVLFCIPSMFGQAAECE